MGAYLTLLLGSMLMMTGVPYQFENVNQRPEILTLYSTKKVYEIGEPIEFEYFYANEEEEKIEERWTYRKEESDLRDILFTKPEALFDDGKYIVSLQLKDEKGNWGEAKECAVKVKKKVRQTEYEYKFGKSPIGVTIDNFEGVNYREYRDIQGMKKIDHESQEGILMMSNSPETIRQTGIAYQEVVKGKGRLLVHHIQQMSENDKRLVVLAQNQENKQIGLTITNKVFKGPGADVLLIGQQVLYEYFGGGKGEHIHLKPQETYVLFDSVKDEWNYNEVISGMLDFQTEGCIKYIVAIVDKQMAIEEIPQLNILERDVHPRGTFNNLSRHYTINLDEIGDNTKIVIGQTKNEWERGRDALTEKECVNRGNFGIAYHLTITATKSTAVILNPRGNMFRGAVKWEGVGAYLAPKYGYFPGLGRAAYLGVIKSGETKELVYMLPCGSSAPVVIGFIPESNWHPQK